MKRDVLCLTAVLALAPLAAQAIDWNKDLVAQVPAAKFKPTQIASAGPTIGTPGRPLPERLYGNSVGGPSMVRLPTCAQEPKGGAARLTLEANGQVGALYTNADGDSLNFDFQPFVVASQGRIFANGAPIGNIVGNQPVLDAVYALHFIYGSVIDSCTSVDSVYVSIYIERSGN